MNVACPGCQTRYSVDDGRIPPSGVTISCPKCHHSFVVKKDAAVALPGTQRPGSGAVALPGAKGGAVPLPGSRSLPPVKPPPSSSTGELDLGLDLDDLSGTSQGSLTPPPRSAPPPPKTAPPPPRSMPPAQNRGKPLADTGLLDFIDDTAQRANVRGAPGATSELRVRRLNGHVEGPYGTTRIVAMLRAGELEGSEEVSEDGRSWRSMQQHPELARAAQEASSRGLDLDLPGRSGAREYDNLPGLAGPRDLPGLPDPHRNLPAPAELPGVASPHRNLPAPADLPSLAPPQRNLPAPGGLPGLQTKRTSAADDLSLPPLQPPRGPAMLQDLDVPDLDLEGRGDRGGGSKVTGMSAEEALALKRGAGGSGIDPSLLELGDVPKMPSIWEQYKKPILAFVGVLALFLIGLITQIWTPHGAFGHKTIAALFEPPPPPPPPAPPPAPAQLVDLNESQQLIWQASYEGFRSVIATLKPAAPNADNLLLHAKALGLATLLYGREAFPIEDLQRALKAAEEVDPSTVKSGNPLAAKHELLKARAAVALLENDGKRVLPELTAALDADQDDRELALLLGLARAAAGEHDDALKAFDRALVIDARYAPAMHAIGELIASKPELGGPQDAVVWFEKATLAEPTHARSALAAAQLFEALQRPGDHRRMLGQAAREASKGLPPNQRAELLHRASRAYVEAERPAEAVELAKEAARLEPANAAYAAMAARALSGAGRGKEAIELLAGTLKRSPEDLGALLARARAYMSTGEVTKAFQDVLTARRVQPKGYEPYLLEGRFNRQLGKLNDARDALIISQRYVGDASPAPAIELGRLELSVGNIDAAFQHATAAVTSHPLSSLAHTLLGETYHHRTQLAEAMEAYEKAIALDSENGTARVGLANALRDLAAKADEPTRAPELAKAFAIYLDALQRNPQDATLFFEYGRALELQGQRGRALALYRDAIAIDEKDVRPHLAMIRQFMDRPQPDLDQAKASLKSAEQIAPLEPDVAYWKARIAYVEKRFEEAQRALEPALAAKPKNADYHYWSGRIYDAMDSIFEAVGEYEQAVQLNSRLGPAYRALGNAAIQRHRFDVARQHFDKYRKAVPDDPTIWLDIGQSWVRQNRDKEALAAFQKVLAAEPANPVALVEIGSIHARRGEDKKAIDHYRRAADADENYGDAWCQLGLAVGPDRRGGDLPKDARQALSRCVSSANAAPELKNTAKQMLSAAGVQTN